MKHYDAFPSRFVKATDCDPPLILTIRLVQPEEMNGEGKQTKPVCYFEEIAKGIVLNVTNYTSITNIAGDDETDTWPGVRVELYRTKVPFHGVPTECIRIRAPRAAKPAVKDDDIPDSWDDEPVVTKRRRSA